MHMCVHALGTEKPLETHREILVALLTSAPGTAGDGIPGHQGITSAASLQGQPVHSRDRTDNTSVGFHMFSGLEKAFTAWHSFRASLCTLGPVFLNFCHCEDRSRHCCRGHRPCFWGSGICGLSCCGGREVLLPVSHTNCWGTWAFTEGWREAK